MNEPERLALLELFATVDAVFTEPDAFAPHKRPISLGRIHRAWRHTRDVLAAQSHIPYRQRIPERAPASERGSNTTDTGDSQQ